MEEQNEREFRPVRKANEEPDVEAHRRKVAEDADKSDESKSDETPDVEGHMKATRK